MAQKTHHDSIASAPTLPARHPAHERTKPRVDRTVEIPGAGLRDAPTTPPRRDAKSPAPTDVTRPPSTPRDAETMDATSSPTSSDRLAQLAAHLPRIARDTYSLGGVVAKGGIGRVRRARDERLDRPVALKELLVWNEAQEQRFVHEALLTARLQHPAIVPIYEAGRWPDGEPFYAMKLVSGRSLADLIAERRRIEDRLSLLPHVLTVAQAVAYAHSQRILHRDLKPANVLVGEFGETVVIDWGLAKGLGEKDQGPAHSGEKPVMTGEGLTIEGAVVGTPAYMPPEQAAGEPVDERADIYAIGAMLYHLLASVPPYDEVPWERLLSAIAEGPPRAIEMLAPAVSDDLSAIVNKAMARDPARRYQAAKDLADDLERFSTGQIVAAHSYSTHQLLLRFWRRNKTPISIAIAAIAALALVLAYAFVETDRERRFAEQKQRDAEEAERKAKSAREDAERSGKDAVDRADLLTLQQAQAALDRDPNEALAWLKTLSPAFSDAAELRRLAADAQARGISRAFRGHTGHVNYIHAAGDRARFVTASDDKTARLWDTRTGESRAFQGHTDEVWGAVVLPDGARVVTSAKDSTARLWDIATGKQLARVDLPEPVRHFGVRRDGSLVATPGDAKGTPWLWDPSAPDVRFLLDRSEPVASSAVSEDGEQIAWLRDDGSVGVSDTSGAHRRTLGKPGAPIRDLRFSASGKELVGTDVFTISVTPPVVWKLDTGEAITIPITKRADQLFVSPDGALLVAAGAEAIEVFDLATKKLVRALPGHGAHLYSAVLSNDGRLLATGGYDRAVHVVDLTTGTLRVYSGLRSVVSSLRFWPDGAGPAVVAASSAGDVRLFEPGDVGRVLTDLHGMSGGAVVSASGRVAAINEEGLFRVLDLDGKVLAEHSIGAAPTVRLMLSSDGERFVGGILRQPEGGLKSTDSRPGGPPVTDGALVIGAFDGQAPLVVKVTGGALSVRPSPAGPELYASLGDGAIVRVDPSGKLTEVDRCADFAFALAVAPDGKSIAVGCKDGGVRLTDLASAKHREIGRHKDTVESLAFSADGTHLASGGLDHTIHLVRLSDGSTRVIEAGGGGVRRLAFSADGATLLDLNSLEAMVRTWAVDSGEALLPFSGHSGAVRGFRISADGRRLATWGADKTSRLCDMASRKCRALEVPLGAVPASRGAPSSGARQEAMLMDVLFAPQKKLVLTLDSAGVLRAWPDDLPETLPELRAWVEAATPDRLDLDKHPSR